MMRAIRAVSTERGRDPREFTLFAFGGNGPVFAATMAQALVMKRVVVPPSPGLFSSFGLLYADVEHHYSRTFRRLLRQVDLKDLNAVWDAMVAEAMEQLAAEGFTGLRARIRRAANMHYQGQTFELTIPIPDGALTADAMAPMEESFGQEHERTYGHRAGPDEPLELVNIQVVAQGIVEGERIPDRFPAHAVGEAVPPRRAYFGPDVGWLKTPVLRRTDLATAQDGPCIVEEYDATCVVPPRARAVLDEYGNIVIDLD